MKMVRSVEKKLSQRKIEKATKTTIGWKPLTSSPYNKSELSPVKIISANGKESYFNPGETYLKV